MDHDVVEDETEVKLDKGYLALYRSELKQINNQFQGNQDQSLPPSYFSPSSYWTSSEKDKFFHALCLHSRLRPDLISAEIGTKTVTDICVYLDILERSSNSCQDSRIRRKTIPAAVEVSEEWITFEENAAVAIALHEPIWEDDDIAASRELECEGRRKEFKARRGEGRTESNERDRDGEKRRRELFKQWKISADQDWERQDALKSLEYPRLKVLEAILREDEENMTVASDLAHNDDVASQPPVDPTIPSIVNDHMIDPVLLAESLGQSNIAIAAENPLADPVDPQNSSSVTLVSHTPHVPIEGSALFPSAPSGLPFSPAQGSSSFSFEPENQESSQSPSLNPEIDDAEAGGNLSPRSRRRFQKRLYMRRKRAMEAGTTVVEHVRKLKPGPKGMGKRKKNGAMTPRTAVQESMEEHHDDVQPDGEQAVQDASERPKSSVTVVGTASADAEAGSEHFANSSGTTLRYKVKNKLTDMGVDATYIHENDMGLFHFSGLGKLMRLYGSFRSDDDEVVTTAISGSTIQFLHASVVNFVREVVQRAITSREQELELKLHTKVWRVADDRVVTKNVFHALELMGIQHVDKAPLFQRLLDSYVDASGTEIDAAERLKTKKTVHIRASDRQHANDGVDDAGGQDHSPANAGATEVVALPPSPLHRDLYGPAVRLPSLYSSACIAVDQRYARSNSTDRNRSLEMDLPMPVETDEEALLVELLEEEDLDKFDCEMDARHEGGLWDQVDVDMDDVDEQVEEESTEEEVMVEELVNEEPMFGEAMEGLDGTARGASYRFRQPDANSRIKSQVYVEDSD